MRSVCVSLGFVIRKIPKLMIQGHGFAPMRHGALRVARRCLCKSLLGLLVLERVQERDAFLNCGLHVGGATRREIHFAKLIGRERPGGLIRPDPRRIKEKKKQQESDERDQGSLVAQGASPFQAVVILPPVVAFGGDKAFDAQPLQKLDAASAREIQWAWSGSSKQVR